MSDVSPLTSRALNGEALVEMGHGTPVNAARELAATRRGSSAIDGKTLTASLQRSVAARRDGELIHVRPRLDGGHCSWLIGCAAPASTVSCSVEHGRQAGWRMRLMTDDFHCAERHIEDRPQRQRRQAAFGHLSSY